jgi:hypothetical protein
VTIRPLDDAQYHYKAFENKDKHGKLYSTDGNTYLNDDVWKGHFLDTDPKGNCLEKNGEACPYMVNTDNNFLSYSTLNGS